MTGLIMFDAVDISQIPAGPAAVAGYVDGRFATAHALAARFPRARLLTIAVDPAHDAECLDVETGDATPASAASWFERQKARGVQRPCLYASVSTMQQDIVPALRAAGVPRAAVRLWSAHYAGLHVCAHDTCGELAFPADGTQWTDRAFGRSLDQSLLAADFFTVAVALPAPSPSPVPAWQEAVMQALPEVREGSTGEAVRTVQGLLTARGHQVTVDGDFGPATAAALAALQHDRGLAADSVAGPVTWPVLLGVA